MRFITLELLPVGIWPGRRTLVHENPVYRAQSCWNGDVVAQNYQVVDFNHAAFMLLAEFLSSSADSKGLCPILSSPEIGIVLALVPFSTVQLQTQTSLQERLSWPDFVSLWLMTIRHSYVSLSHC
jgi:hypothetical protein